MTAGWGLLNRPTVPCDHVPAARGSFVALDRTGNIRGTTPVGLLLCLSCFAAAYAVVLFWRSQVPRVAATQLGTRGCCGIGSGRTHGCGLLRDRGGDVGRRASCPARNARDSTASCSSDSGPGRTGYSGPRLYWFHPPEGVSVASTPSKCFQRSPFSMLDKAGGEELTLEGIGDRGSGIRRRFGRCDVQEQHRDRSEACRRSAQGRLQLIAVRPDLKIAEGIDV